MAPNPSTRAAFGPLSLLFTWGTLVVSLSGDEPRSFERAARAMFSAVMPDSLAALNASNAFC